MSARARARVPATNPRDVRVDLIHTHKHTREETGSVRGDGTIENVRGAVE